MSSVGLTLPLPLVGESPEVVHARTLAFAAPAAALLIVAEDGLEPAAVAAFIHARTEADAPFVVVDCSGPTGDVERELFGRRDVTATGGLEPLGASSALVEASSGTVFLLHLAELSSAAQRRLARLLRDGEGAVGARGRAHTIARVIASVPADVDTAIADGRLRADLIRRFSAERLTLPALRSRQKDIPELIASIASSMADGTTDPSGAFTPAALTMLSALPWRRNVDELRFMLERLLRGSGPRPIRQEDVLAALAGEGGGMRFRPHVSLREARRRFEQDYIAAVLEEHQWRMSDAARTLGIERANLYRKARQLGIARRLSRKVADAS